jgi:alpha-methylacyl-CoA racemase
MGPLKGIKLVEMVGIGPAPHCCMLLADMGAEIIRIDRPGGNKLGGRDEAAILNRGRQSVALDLKTSRGVETALKLISKADGIIEGFRPGVMERLGLGPNVCLERNDRLVYGRMTGWGQDGPLANVAGHDINYIALAGALGSIGDQERGPVPPLNLVGDFGGGGMMLAFGMVCGLLETKSSGKGQVIDAAMLEGSALLMAGVLLSKNSGSWESPRGQNWLDGGAPFYNTYQCIDEEWICIGCIEPQFYALLREQLKLEDELWDQQWDRKLWPLQKKLLKNIFNKKTRTDWGNILGDLDVCFAPVLNLDEIMDHPHNKARGVFLAPGGNIQPAPAPRFSRTPGTIQSPPVRPGENNSEALERWGFEKNEIEALRNDRIISDPD